MCVGGWGGVLAGQKEAGTMALAAKQSQQRNRVLWEENSMLSGPILDHGF